jgi:hypothetical protein
MLKTARMVALLGILLNHGVIALRRRTLTASHLAVPRLHAALPVLQTAAIGGPREHRLLIGLVYAGSGRLHSPPV